MGQGARPSRTVCLAVLPFDNLSTDDARAEPDYFSRGFVEDLITFLSRFPELDVMAAHSARRLANARQDPDPEKSEHSGVDYLLEGSVRRTNAALRLSARLVTPSGRVIWSERFDRALGDVFAMQDEITAQVASSLSLRINESQLSLARHKPLTELFAYDAWLRGVDQLREGTLSADEQARSLFDLALSRDPTYARAQLGLSLSYFNEWSCQLWSRWDDNETRAYEHARRASELDPDDHYARIVLGRILLYRREFELAEHQFERALALNHNDADALVQLTMGFGLLGQPERALSLFERARRLNPYHEPWYAVYALSAAFALEDWSLMLAAGRSAPIDIMVDLPAFLAIALHETGDRAGAREHVDIFLAQFAEKIARDHAPGRGEALRWVQHVNPFKQQAHRERLDRQLRAAGLSGKDAPEPLATAQDRRALRKVGSLWQASFAGRDAHFPDLKGLYDIARLLSEPGKETHCAELMGAHALSEPDSSDTTLDERALRDYRARVAQLDAAIEEAERHNDLGNLEALRTERDELLAHLSSSLGLGGRPRKLGAPSERARSAVTWRIRSALKKVKEAHPELSEHLRKTIQTGTFCSYQPGPDPSGAKPWLL